MRTFKMSQFTIQAAAAAEAEIAHARLAEEVGMTFVPPDEFLGTEEQAALLQVRFRRWNDERVIANTIDWPMWPYLPVKRRINGGWPEVGFLVDDGEKRNKIRIYRENLLTFVDGGVQDLSKLVKCEYDSLSEMFDDRWEVD